MTAAKIAYNTFTLPEAVAIASQTKPSEIILYTPKLTNFRCLSAVINSSTLDSGKTCASKACDSSAWKIASNFSAEELTSIISYFEPAQLVCVNINPACARLYLENISVSPRLLFEKVVNKTIFIVHKKNNEYCRTGPFVFKEINQFFEKLFTFNSISEINSGGGSTIRTVAYIDIYNHKLP